MFNLYKLKKYTLHSDLSKILTTTLSPSKALFLSLKLFINMSLDLSYKIKQYDNNFQVDIK